MRATPLRCPSCQVVMTTSEHALGVCPVCNESLDKPEPPPVAPPPPPPPARRPFPLAALIVAIAAIIFAAAFQFAFRPKPGPPEPAQSDVAPPNPIPAEAPKPDPAPEPAPGTQPPAPAGSAAIPPEAPRFQEFEEDPIFEVKRGKAELTKNADGSRTLSRLDSRTRVKLRGATGTLRVLGVSGNSSLDASDLDAREIIFTGEIDGRSSVKLFAPNGRIEFRGLVTGRSQVTITAVNGIVIFGNPADPAPRTIIDDSCRLTILTGELNLAGTVNGMSTELFVGFPGEGVLKFRELAGNTRLVYDRAVGNFPEVHVEAGKITGQATLIRNR